jgi:MarR family transcriptional regulator, organic hydroperoxide resistance regulator
MNKVRQRAKAAGDFLPVDISVGYQIRMTHRALQRYLQAKLEPHGVTLGMWYYLRALWEEDGLTQRELSDRMETMEPSTLSAIQVMERGGLVRRVRSKSDRRKLHIFLTPKASGSKEKLLPLAREVVDAATANMTQSEIKSLLRGVTQVRKNINARLKDFDGER